MNKYENNISWSEKYEIEKYCNIDEGFKEILPDLCKPEVNPSIAFAIEQMTFHRKFLQEWLDNNSGTFEERYDFAP